jgi:hypothetical protein
VFLVHLGRFLESKILRRIEMSYQGKVNRTQGGDALNVDTGGKITANGVQAPAIADISEDAGTFAAGEREKFNEILAALRGAGIIAAS